MTFKQCRAPVPSADDCRQGRRCRGGSGSLRFRGPDHLQLIVSRRNPHIPENGVGAGSGDAGTASKVSQSPSARPWLARQSRIVIGYDRQRRDDGTAHQQTRHATVFT